jgi:TonB family protein
METRRWMTRLLFGAAILLTAVGSLRADDPLSDVKQLYATAAYEETLVALAQFDDSPFIDQVDEYRALCLIALHRDADAEHAVERLVLHHPLPLESLTDRSPKFTVLYQTVRRRLLPGLANEAYSVAKASFEARDYSTAARQFSDALELLRSAEEPAALHDLELLANEFRGLAEERMTPGDPEPVPDSAPAPAVVGAPASAPWIPPPFHPVPRLYDIADPDVAPPVVLVQALPPWNPPLAYVGRRTYTGQLRVVVGEDGRVTSADILQPSFGPYDELLLHAVKQWRYRPALKRGYPVQYRWIVDYVLKSADQTSAQR